MIILGVESFRLRTTSAQWDMVVLKRINTKIQVDIVGTAGGSGIFNISLGSENSFVKEMRRFLVHYCEENGFRYGYSKS
ncbi:hypothetical protein N9L43_01005 [bacterium]|nr:hypothetical protein [bacterium]